MRTKKKQNNTHTIKMIYIKEEKKQKQKRRNISKNTINTMER